MPLPLISYDLYGIMKLNKKNNFKVLSAMTSFIPLKNIKLFCNLRFQKKIVQKFLNVLPNLLITYSESSLNNIRQVNILTMEL